MKVECTWGDGPDVMMSLDGSILVLHESADRKCWAHGTVSDGSLDLTAKEAQALGVELIAAARQAMDMDKTCAEHDEVVEKKAARKMEWKNIECESCGGAHRTVECDKTYKLRP